MPNRTFWIDAKESLEQNSKTTSVSSTILGIGIIFVSLLILSIGLIVGLKFPGFAEERIIEDQCIVSDENSNFKKWEYDEDWVRSEKLYFWTTTNSKAVLKTGIDPNFQRVGPYIYHKSATKTDITFRNGFVSFKYIIHYNFDEERTRLECGITCKEDNTIVVINGDQIEEILNYKRDDNYFLGNIPEWINLKIKDISARQTNTSESIFSLLGSLNNTLITDETLVQLVQNVSFGVWVGLNDSKKKIVLNTIREGTSFTTSEMEKFFEILSSDLVPDIHEGNNHIKSVCINFISTTSCFENEIISNTSSSDPKYNVANEYGLNYTNFRNICGLVLLLHYLNESNVNCFVNSSEWVKDLFCFQNDTNCRILFSNYSYLTNFLITFKSFIFEKLLSPVMEWSITNIRANIFKNTTIRQVAIGHDTGTEFKYGTLTKQMTKESGDHFSLPVKYSTCLLERKSANNMILYKYNDLEISLQNNIHYTYFIPPIDGCQTCTSHEPSVDYFYLFSEEYHCSLPFKRQSQKDYSGVDVYRYAVDISSCSSSDAVRCCTEIENHHLDSYSGSFVDIEPLSGKMWRKLIKEDGTFDFSVEKDFINVILTLNLSTYSFPMSSRESTVEISQQNVGEFKTRIKQMMDASCAVMITLSVIATIVFVLAMLILFWPKAPTKVHPFLLERSINMTNSRV